MGIYAFILSFFVLAFQSAYGQDLDDGGKMGVEAIDSARGISGVKIKAGKIEDPVYFEEVCGELIPSRVKVEEGELVLNGTGLRRTRKYRMMFDIYVASLYVNEIHEDPNAIINSQFDKQIDIYFLRDLEKDQVKDSYEWKEGLEEQGLLDSESDFDISILHDAVLSDVKEGQKMTILVSNDEVSFFLDDEFLHAVYHSEFARAILNVYLLGSPPHSRLSEGLLGNIMPSCD